MPMTKKERELLRSNKCQIEPPKEPPLRYTVQMSLTEGELLALKNGMEFYSDEGRSIVGQDVRDYINNALERAGVKLLF